MTSEGRRVVVVTGATGGTGRATCVALVERGERVVAVGRDDASLASLAAEVGSDLLTTRVCDLLDGDAVRALAAEIVDSFGGVDALFHLVGGWRGGKLFTESTDEDWAWLSGNLVDTLRHTTLALHDTLVASGRGRVAIVSAAAASTPTAGNAAYAAAKAAAETWLASLADSFASADVTPGSAATTGVVKWIGEGRTATRPAEVATWLVSLLDGEAAALNGARAELWPGAERA
ncbi:SDR family oxidoreductase [Intrasporangium sp. YIM S08009]|uniref:SDR family oxidoreductase n=1 Tax=Intrasporangium zincisolvens TaxID=3080018 RepID=UPI002B05BE65|nr:SDR family NAD(P)-dependent oxidoreductase [Intrasporangium sp. YIM S08009]